MQLTVGRASLQEWQALQQDPTAGTGVSGKGSPDLSLEGSWLLRARSIRSGAAKSHEVPS